MANIITHSTHSHWLHIDHKDYTYNSHNFFNTNENAI